MAEIIPFPPKKKTVKTFLDFDNLSDPANAALLYAFHICEGVLGFPILPCDTEFQYVVNCAIRFLEEDCRMGRFARRNLAHYKKELETLL